MQALQDRGQSHTKGISSSSAFKPHKLPSIYHGKKLFLLSLWKEGSHKGGGSAVPLARAASMKSTTNSLLWEKTSGDDASR